MSRLQLLMTQYNETEDVSKAMLDSIEIQRNIDLQNDIEVFIGNDGSETKLSKEFLEKYSFPIKYFSFPHSGVAGCRKYLFDQSTSEYVMFCDIDDMFLNSLALSIILKTINTGFDSLICDYMVEIKKKDQSLTYTIAKKDGVQVHGKVYRRQFLLDNKIQWHPELHEHQDSPFNCLALSLSKDTKYIDIPLYTWRNNKDSISRKNGEMHRPLTWPHMIDSYDALVEDLMIRGYGKNARHYAMSCLYATYFEMGREPWQRENSAEYRFNTYQRISNFFFKYELLLLYLNDEKEIEKIKTDAKRNAEKAGKLYLPLTIEEWMQTILNMFPRCK